jgi:Cdc6-like AAA superfamily ATPase
MNKITISDFLPKYPNIHKRESGVLNPYDDETFGGAIYKKKEFYNERLPPVEEFPDKKGELMRHQKIISRFLSSYTMYDELLLYHEMGSGKTCTSIAVIEKIKNETNMNFKGALIFARGEGLLNNYISELVFKCTDGRYIPDNYERLNKLERIHRVKKLIHDFYKFYTFETFAKDISRMSDDDIRRQFSDYIVIIDEVHNIRIQEHRRELSIYDQFHRFLHVISNTKILLLSGTPMKDTFYLFKDTILL